MRKIYFNLAVCISAILGICSCAPNGVYEFDLLTTNDVHGSWFDKDYVTGAEKNSLFAINHYVDSIRTADGAENVILVDAGDCLQGNNAPYYYNYVDTITPHMFPRLVSYMKYDAVAVGNHDVEVGHSVYDRVRADMDNLGVPFLAGNAFNTQTGQTYFQSMTMLKRHGIKIAILGYTNPNIKAWLDESLWTGIEFRSLIPLVQQDVDKVQRQEKPEIVIVVVHSGTGKGDGSMYENQGLDLFNSLQGVDFLVCSHDHREKVFEKENICLINSGSRARNFGFGRIKLTMEHGKVVSKELSAETVPVKASLVDTVMRNKFQSEYEAVQKFTLRKVGELNVPLVTRDAYKGMSAYINLLHTLSLSNPLADISLAAPLTYNRTVKPGTLIYGDLFTIYPFENQLFIVKMSGGEIKDCLEYSYDNWINTISTSALIGNYIKGDNSSDKHILKIVPNSDPRFAQQGWSFVNRAYNFDSAGGINYTVDVTKKKGSRIKIKSLADGRAFSEQETYNVAMTSYRANGGGGILREGAGIDTDRIDDRIVARYPEIRELLYDYLKANGKITKENISIPTLIGTWKFVPEKLADSALEKDMNLLFK